MVGTWPARVNDQPYFFLSYHRSRYRPEGGSDPDVWVRKLYQALCHDVAQLASTANPGFMDVQTPLGSSWPDELADALARCRVFVALISPGYFASEYCGKEWAAFTRRVQMQATVARPHVAIIPALWTPYHLDDLPPPFRNLNLIPPEFPKAYKDEGFYGLMKLRRHNSAYTESVLLMAKTIQRVAVDLDLAPCAPFDMGSLRSAFADHQPDSATHQIRVRLAAYPAASEFNVDRRSARTRTNYYYGRTMREWAPYRSAADATPIAMYAESVISALGHSAIVEPLDEPAAAAVPSPSVMLLDPWAAGVGEIGDRLRVIDSDPTHVVVPWNSDDDETAREAARLQDDLREVMRNSLALNGSAPWVPTLETFRAAFPKTVNEAIAKHFKTAPAYPPAQPPSMDRPTLEGPEA